MNPMEQPSLEGWAPEPSDTLPLSGIIDRAFDYRGNTTIVKADGTQIEGYLFNRNNDVAEPFVQIFDADGDGLIRIRYSEIRTIRFTGKDPAAGNSYAAWLRRKADPARRGADPAVHDDRTSGER